MAEVRSKERRCWAEREEYTSNLFRLLSSKEEREGGKWAYKMSTYTRSTRCTTTLSPFLAFVPAVDKKEEEEKDDDDEAKEGRG